MRKFALLSLAVLAFAAAPAAAGDERLLSESFPAAELDALRFEMSVGELRVVAGGEKVELEVEAECRWRRERCEEALEDLRIDHRKRGDVLIVELEGYPKWGKGRLEVKAVLRLPADLDFDLDMGVGEAEIEGLLGEIDAELGVGHVRVSTASAHLRSIDLDVGVGEAQIRGDRSEVEGRRPFLVGSEAYWGDGPGEKRIKVDVGVGEVEVWLD